MNFDPRNILVIDFGQLGDVVLSLPALRAIRARFRQARITVAVGKSGKTVIELAGCADAVLIVDRVGLRDGFAPLSVVRIAQLVREVRRRKFDFVIDLHSLSETNLLGYLSRARWRLYASRPNRSLDFLSNFRPRPPVEDQRRHAVDRYLDVLRPLDLGEVSRVARLPVRDEDRRAVEQLLKKEKVSFDLPLVGLFPGAGHPSRRWPLERFAELAARFERNDGLRVLVFLGPEERPLLGEMRALFSRTTVFLNHLTIPQLAAALAPLAAFVSNDTGPLHIAAAVGAPVVMLLGHPTNKAFVPVGERHRVIHSHTITEITVDESYAVARSVLTDERATSLFAV
ncbi:MAG: glycosyltransferase family 9 protein [Pyrinomonadaceae bacterium]|nr:glycosyltransferase family 9 protein [Pyrinomonadaceae bacterium]MDQ3133920.1 glycosyltransferase family 9 protein [Acidobacteriota bacterium]